MVLYAYSSSCHLPPIVNSASSPTTNKVIPGWNGGVIHTQTAYYRSLSSRLSPTLGRTTALCAACIQVMLDFIKHYNVGWNFFFYCHLRYFQYLSIICSYKVSVCSHQVQQFMLIWEYYLFLSWLAVQARLRICNTIERQFCLIYASNVKLGSYDGTLHSEYKSTPFTISKIMMELDNFFVHHRNIRQNSAQ